MSGRTSLAATEADVKLAALAKSLCEPLTVKE